MAGRKGKHQADRRIHYWGHCAAELTFGGLRRKSTVDRPRLRFMAGKEVQLPVLSHLRAMDPLPARVLNQVLLGVSTRGYERSLEAAPTAKARGTGKSAASRHLVSRMGARMRDHLMRKLDDVRVEALVMNGVLIACHTVVVALGILADGTKVPLGLWQGSTENAAVCTALLQDFVSRSLRIEGRVLCVIDGGKGLRKAIADVFGEATLVQRCQIHKRRNVREHLPKRRQKHVDAVMRQAYKSGSADTARKQAAHLAASLDAEGHDGAAASVREGLEETLTVLKLRLPATLARAFGTTNCIETLLSTVRRVARNVKRWRGGDMVKRWTAAGVLTAAAASL
jgi:transposase-like protein